MEDMDDVRNNFGTVADFSNWGGIKASGGFKSMKTISKETVIEEPSENLENELNEIKPVKEEIKPVKEEIKPVQENKEKSQFKKNINEIPAANEAVISPIELKNIAVKLLPSVDKLENGEKYVEYCEKAIDMAFTFLKVWDLKVSIGGN